MDFGLSMGDFGLYVGDDPTNMFGPGMPGDGTDFLGLGDLLGGAGDLLGGVGDLGMGLLGGVGNLGMGLLGGMGGGLGDMGMGMLLGGMMGSLSQSILPRTVGMPSFGSGMPSFGSGMPSFGSGMSPFGSGMDASSASGTLASYMNQNGIKNLDTNDLYKLSQNTSGDVPQGVQNAAKYMLQNPDVYKQIETHDVAGADGKCGIGNFDWAAQGGLWGA